MNLTGQAISKHLTVLKNADLVNVRWEGCTKLHSRVVYELTTP